MAVDFPTVGGNPGQGYGLPMSGPQTITNGLMTATPLHVVMENEKAKSAETQAKPLTSSLAGYVRNCWVNARTAKMQFIEPRMMTSMRARRGEYDPDKLGQIRAMGGSEIFAMLTSVKCRAAGSWIRDVLMGAGEDKPWSIKASPLPDLPPQINQAIVMEAVQPIKQAMMAGAPLSEEDVREIMLDLKQKALQQLKDQAMDAADRMSEKMEDQLIEGGFLDALDKFIDDLTTFPTAVIKGPIIRKKPSLAWVKDQTGNYVPKMQETLQLGWERVSPFDIYPSPAAVDVTDGYLIERHKMARQDLNDLIGVEGYDDSTIRVVLDEYGRGGLHEWLTNDVAIAQAEGKSTVAVAANYDALIDALQFWGSVPGKWLIEWGMDEKDVPDETKEYHIECWLIGNYVIKAVLNYDPLSRKPYYKASYEDVPGSWWGNSVADLVRDAQAVVNASARALVNNMGMASGPQVAVNVDRLPPGEQISTLEPWRIWQVTSDPISGQGDPVKFFQPQSNIQELMGVFEKFSELADEYSGIPRYLTGDTTGGAGRTASGLSLLVNNAGKSIKQVISNVDMNVMTPLLQRLYSYNMQYASDPDLKGDVNIIAHGANALIAKEAAQVRRNEFLAATANPIDMQIIGLDGRAAVLREVARGLDMDTDKIVPPPDVLAQKIKEIQAAMAAQQAMAMTGAPGTAPPEPIPGLPPNPNVPQGLPAPGQGGTPGGSPANPTINAQTLGNGAPITDNFTPPSQNP